MQNAREKMKNKKNKTHFPGAVLGFRCDFVFWSLDLGILDFLILEFGIWNLNFGILPTWQTIPDLRFQKSQRSTFIEVLLQNPW